ncbi:MAG: hypothetical protein ACFE9I_18685 [Candidatus Hermodarchaeota archaeon]
MDEKENDILLEDSYMVNIIAYPVGDYEKFYDNNVLWANKDTVDFLFEIVSLLKYEVDEISETGDPTDKLFVRVASTLSGNFRSEFLETGDLEKHIINYIKKLKESKYTIRKEGSYRGSPDYKEVEISFDEIKGKLIKIRNHKIKFYEKMLEEYRKNREQYNNYLKATHSI